MRMQQLQSVSDGACNVPAGAEDPLVSGTRGARFTNGLRGRGGNSVRNTHLSYDIIFDKRWDILKGSESSVYKCVSKSKLEYEKKKKMKTNKTKKCTNIHVTEIARDRNSYLFMKAQLRDWEFHITLIPFLMDQLGHAFAHVTLPQLPLHVQNCVMIRCVICRARFTCMFI